jgi:hypothetical protein
MSAKVPYKERRMRWRGLLDERCQSGLSTGEFCRQRGLALWQFYYWHGRLAGPPQGGVAAGRDDTAGAGAEELLFAPVVLPSGGAGLRLRLGGLEVEVAPDFDEATLKRLLRAMGAAC